MSDKTVVLNAKKMNFDGNLDFSVLSSDVTVYDDTTPEQLLERIEGADIIVTKEMPVNGDLIRKFPASVKLICEAGTGYNNLDLDAAREKGITVCNIPAYSSERVAHTAVMMILNLSIGIFALEKYKIPGWFRGLIPFYCEIDIVFPCDTLKGFYIAIRNLNGLCTLSLTDQLFYRNFPMRRLLMLLMLQIHLHCLL